MLILILHRAALREVGGCPGPPKTPETPETRSEVSESLSWKMMQILELQLLIVLM